jgi:hypothetical protein
MHSEGRHPDKWMAAILHQSYVKPVVRALVFTAGVPMLIVYRVVPLSETPGA